MCGVLRPSVVAGVVERQETDALRVLGQTCLDAAQGDGCQRPLAVTDPRPQVVPVDGFGGRAHVGLHQAPPQPRTGGVVCSRSRRRDGGSTARAQLRPGRRHTGPSPGTPPFPTSRVDAHNDDGCSRRAAGHVNRPPWPLQTRDVGPPACEGSRNARRPDRRDGVAYGGGMSSAGSPLPSIRVILPDDQEFSRARGVARGVTQRIRAAWVSYDDVPTHRLPREADQAPPSDRWAWKVQQVPPRDRRPGWFAVHIWDCGVTSAGDPGTSTRLSTCCAPWVERKRARSVGPRWPSAPSSTRARRTRERRSRTRWQDGAELRVLMESPRGFHPHMKGGGRAP